MMNNAKDRIGSIPSSKNIHESVVRLSYPSIPDASATEILTSSEIMTELFRTRLPEIIPGNSELIECVPKILRKRIGNRQVISFQLIFSDGAESITLVLKRYADKIEGRRIYTNMRMLWDSGFNLGSVLRITEPVAYLDDLGLLVQGEARGIQVRKNLNQSGSLAPDLMKAVARWLTKLHQLQIDPEGISPHPDEETTIREFAKNVGLRDPDLAGRMDELAAVILEKLSAFGNVAPVPVHGDFQCENIFVDNEIITAIDFDKLCRSDPARDPGYMIAQMRADSVVDSVSHEIVHLRFKAFWDEYLRTMSEGQGETLPARASLFAARKCLQNIEYVLAYMSPGEDMKRVFLLLDEAERFAKTDRVERVLQIPVSSGR